jgi:hypothetical protein
VNPTIVANAVVTTSVLDLDDLPVAGVPDPLTMAAVGGDPGSYLGTIPDTASLPVGEEVHGTIDAVLPTGEVRQFDWTAYIRE